MHVPQGQLVASGSPGVDAPRAACGVTPTGGRHWRPGKAGSAVPWYDPIRRGGHQPRTPRNRLCRTARHRPPLGGDAAGGEGGVQTSSHSLRTAGSARRLAGVPSNTMLPWPMTRTRSEIDMAMVSFCSISKTETPRLLSFLQVLAHQLHDLGRQAFGGLVDDDEIGITHQGTAQASASAARRQTARRPRCARAP